MPSRIAPSERSFLIKKKSIRIPKSFFHFEDDQIDRDRHIRKRKERIKKLNNIIDSAKK
jgi:histone deacetylase complex regulatory component SIN3